MNATRQKFVIVHNPSTGNIWVEVPQTAKIAGHHFGYAGYFPSVESAARWCENNGGEYIVRELANTIGK